MDTTRHSQGLDNEDSFEAIFALNMGDFVTEHLISDDLLQKISHTITTDPDRLRKQLEELIQIYSLDNTLSLLGFNANQEFVLYDSMAASLAEMLQADSCHIFQTMYKDEKEHFLSLTGTSLHGVPKTRWNIGYELDDTDSIIVEAYEDDFPMVLTEVSQETSGWKPLEELNQQKVRSFIAVPLHEGQKQNGLLLFETYEVKDFAQESVDLAEATGKVFVVSLYIQRLLENAQKLMGQAEPSISEMLSLRAQLTESIADLGRYQQFFVESLAYAIDARNDFTHGHSQGVAQIAKRIAEALNLSEKTIDLVYYAGLLGALGKIQIPQEILTKEEALTPTEWESLRNSPNMGVGLLMKMNFLAEVIPYVDYQKERWDGKDSPHGLSGRSIPLGARIIAVADAYHALTHPRPYRKEPLSEQEALKVLQSEAGSKWDPDVIESLAKIASDSDA
jgi:HD-GYP domain-containing protein (c-di-GMP phosphodiesterase class II)